MFESYVVNPVVPAGLATMLCCYPLELNSKFEASMPPLLPPKNPDMPMGWDRGSTGAAAA